MAIARTTKQIATDQSIAGETPGLDGTPGEEVAAKPAAGKAPAKNLVPANPEKNPPAEARRTRLSKAFARPLDKKFRKETFVRDRFTIPASEYAALVACKKRLGEQGVEVKKSELIRVGLSLLGELDDDEVKAELEKLTAPG